jgi:hypothetical protein
MTHDYKRNGTTTLFAAPNMLDGRVIGTCMPRHRHREFLRFLKLIDAQTRASPHWRPPSWLISKTTTPILSHSFGPSLPPRFSKKWRARNKR